MTLNDSISKTLQNAYQSRPKTRNNSISMSRTTPMIKGNGVPGPGAYNA